MQALGCGPPVLHLGFRLGEGTGAVLAVPLLRSAAAIMRDMASLDDVLAAP
jgi:nicotinate-nucleotide--dimethylbenzimidazole phosphoribosyltransferase